MNNPGCLQGEPIWLETRRARRWGNRNTGNISPSVLVPRNPLEETWVANLLRSRLPEALFWDMERTALQQRPVAFTPDNGRPFHISSGFRRISHDGAVGPAPGALHASH